VPAYIPGNHLHFYSPFDNLRERFERQQLFENFPQPLEGMASTKDFHQLPVDGSVTIDGVTISCLEMNHPGRSFAYRFAEEGKVFIFATDAEFTMVQLDNMEQYRDFFQDADILVLDSQYTLEEAFYKFDWGHTSFSMAVNLGVGWNVKKLIMTHHDPAYTDEKLNSIYHEAYEHRAQLGNDALEIYQAVQEMEFHL
jgi:phosphoribosyl 1,2-cyclic phosphodiesterase